MQLKLQTHLTSAHFGIAFLIGALMLSPLVLAGSIPEPTSGLPDMESIAYKAKETPTIDGDLSDWENAAFVFLGEQKDVFRGDWGGRDDLSYVWSVMWDENAFYFAAAIWDDVYQELANANEPWTGDCLFLYIDANVDSTIDNKPCFFLFGGQPTVFAAAGGVQPGDVELAIVMEPQLGEAGRIFEVAIPLGSMTNMSPAEGGEFRMMPGYEEGTQGAEAGKFIDWDGLNPDDAANLRKVTFGGLIDNSGPKRLADRPSPADGDMLEATWANLSWQPGDWAVSHDLYISTSFDDVNNGAEGTFVANTMSDFQVVGFPGFPIPEGLVPGTTYYWRIDEVNDTEPNSPWKGPVWSFSIPPKTAYFPDPSDGAESVETDVTLSWTMGFGAKLHTVYFGDNFDDVDNAAGGLPQGSSTFTPSPLELAKTYYWRVDEFDAVDTFKGKVWSFTTQGAVQSLDPLNGTLDVKQTAILTWLPSVYAASHEVYFGADKDAVKNADIGSPEYKGTRDLGAESYDPGMLEWDTNYYWRIDEVNNANPDSPWKGILWSFTTADFLVVDDFESYNDIDPPDPESNRIFEAWLDGYEIPTNGALVGNDLPPYAEQTIVHSGNQSMPLFYDNSVGYSEATLTLTYPRDWTENGVSTLTIWFRGNSANAAETLYVALNGSAVVNYDNPNATQINKWTQWNIDLQAFGVNLANVNTIALGLGNRNNPQAGGSGTMYFDDIRLYAPAP
ncbi:MAG TPA: sugar-binding protein [Sedimentisphaerales bacterium]|nr:sugar-binding protein [Sedimentisphaerales bacterium]